MAYPTAEQAKVMLELGTLYGPPARAQIEHTEEPYGIIWCHWPQAEQLGHELGDRNLFIKPDGTRLSWDRLPPKVF